VSGTVLPVSYHEQLELIVDPELLAVPELFFNAARLDRSIALSTEDYVRLTEPRIERITAPDPGRRSAAGQWRTPTTTPANRSRG
jgi:Ala-tRNA(Pro) deacylase